MNKQRRKWLQDIIDALENQKQEIESLTMEEQEAFDNMPESLQDSERGQTMSDNIDNLESATSDLEDVIMNLQEIIEN